MVAEKLLRRAARLLNVQTVHYDGLGQRVEPPPESILRVLGMVGAHVDKMSDVAGALRERRQFLWQQAIDPVIVAWNGGPTCLNLRVPSQLAQAAVNYTVAQFFGGTSLLIAVSVAFDLVQKIDSHLVMRNYRGLLET